METHGGAKSSSDVYWLQSAKSHLIKLSERMRALDEEAGLAHSAIADLLLLYGNTSNWFQAVRDYKVSCNPHPFRLITL